MDEHDRRMYLTRRILALILSVEDSELEYPDKEFIKGFAGVLAEFIYEGYDLDKTESRLIHYENCLIEFLQQKGK